MKPIVEPGYAYPLSNFQDLKRLIHWIRGYNLSRRDKVLLKNHFVMDVRKAAIIYSYIYSSSGSIAWFERDINNLIIALGGKGIRKVNIKIVV